MDEKNKNIENSIPEKRSIRNIPLTKKQSKELEKIEEEMQGSEILTPPIVSSPSARPTLRRAVANRSQSRANVENGEKKNGGHNGLLWSAAAILCLVLIYGVAHYFTRATVSIVRAEETIVLNENNFNLLAAENQNLISSTTLPVDSVLYVKSTFNLTASTSVSANGQQTIQKKATGKIVVYNDSNSSQLLIATTRFQSPEGLIFRLNKQVTVPAKKNVTVDVTADQAGEKYNIGPKTFSLPALSGTTKAKTVYGKSSASMRGGLVTTVPQTATSDLSAAKAVLQENIKQMATTKSIAEIPEGYVLLADSMVIKSGEVKQTYNATSKSAILTQNAAIDIYYLEEKSLSSAVASKSSLFSFSTSSISAQIDTVSLSARISTDNDVNNLYLNGSSTVLALFDGAKLSGEISGLSRKEALSLIKSSPGVEAVEISVQPWWERRLPEPESIKVEIE